MFRPRPPAFVEMRKTKALGLELNSSTMVCGVCD
jgi:hypothetical protein